MKDENLKKLKTALSLVQNTIIEGAEHAVWKSNVTVLLSEVVYDEEATKVKNTEIAPYSY